MLIIKKNMADPRLNRVYETRFPVVDLPPGTTVGDFVVKESVTQGGLGSVYMCTRADLHEQVQTDADEDMEIESLDDEAPQARTQGDPSRVRHRSSRGTAFSRVLMRILAEKRDPDHPTHRGGRRVGRRSALHRLPMGGGDSAQFASADADSGSAFG